MITICFLFVASVKGYVNVIFKTVHADVDFCIPPLFIKNLIGFIKIMLANQLIRALPFGLCHPERHRFEPRITNYFLSVLFTLYCRYEFTLSSFFRTSKQTMDTGRLGKNG